MQNGPQNTDYANFNANGGNIPQDSGYPVYDAYGNPVAPSAPPYPGQDPFSQPYDMQGAYTQANPQGFDPNASFTQPGYDANASFTQPGAYGAVDPFGASSADYDRLMNTDPSVEQQPNLSPEGKQARKIRKKPNSGKKGIKGWLIALLVVAILGSGAFLLLKKAGQSGGNTAVIEMGQMGSQHSGTALIVRDETAYSEEGVQSIEYVADEGSMVARGDVICRVYSTGYSAKETSTLQGYREQIKEYQQTLLSSETSYDQKMTRLETDVVEKGLEVRSLVQGALGDMKAQEEVLATAIDNRQNYFRSKYSSDMRMDRLYDDEETQLQRIDSWIKQKISTSESIVSFYTDGFETALTPDNFQNYSPSEVRSMIRGIKPESSSSARGKTDLYRLVQQSNFAVLLLMEDTHWNPEEGKAYKLVLEQYTEMAFDAKVLSVTRSGGDLLVRLAVIGDITQVLYTRSCSARLGEYVDCMVVPESAIYQQNGMDGVVVLQEDHSTFIPVTVLERSGGKAYISAVTTGMLSSGQTVRLFQ